MRQKSATNRFENVELAATRRDKPETEGGFRTLLQNEGVFRRAGLANWSSDALQVGKGFGGVVYNQMGKRHDTRKVLPVPSAPSGIMEVFRGWRGSRSEAE